MWLLKYSLLNYLNYLYMIEVFLTLLLFHFVNEHVGVFVFFNNLKQLYFFFYKLFIKPKNNFF